MSEKNKEIDVRHGCTDCVHYEKPTNKEPCKSCDKWNNWKDNRQKSIVLDMGCQK